MSNTSLLVPIIIIDHLPLPIIIPDLGVVLLASLILVETIRRFDRDSIISLRRTFGLLFVATIIWGMPLAVGAIYSIVTSSHQPLVNEFILGAFFAWSFELVVVNGTFVRSTTASTGLGALHPVGVMLLTTLFISASASSELIATLAGIVVLTLALVFMSKFKAFKTEGTAIDSLRIFQAFLKTWVSQKPNDLEGCLAVYSRDEPVTTKIILMNTGRQQTAVVLPGVHPGPFFPVGSYNISELIYHEIRRNDIIPIVLHGMGGHERNVPMNDVARSYANEIARTVTSQIGKQMDKMRGPTHSKAGITNVTSLGFGDDVVGLLSNAPYVSDDLDPEIIDDAEDVASELGVKLMLVDAHNCIGGEKHEQTHVTRADWKDVLLTIRGDNEQDFELGVAHSSELDFPHGSDISDGGIGALLFRKGSKQYALITADANNAAVGLRQRISDQLKQIDTEFIELCTSDTHNLSARNLVNRGYRALGEDTNPDTIIKVAQELVTLARGRLSKCAVTILELHSTLPLIGSKSLVDFADLTARTLKFAKAFGKVTLVLAAVLSLVTLFY